MASLDEQATMFGNRLRKNARRLKKWLRRENISCYRLYDRDIPEVAVSVDRYGDKHAVVSVYARRERDERWGNEWVERMMDVVVETLGIDPNRAYVKTRERQKGDSQYTRFGSDHDELVVKEGGLEFLVNLSDYLDTGLFLDHRTTRGIVRDESRGLRMLNLFAYTGTFSVYAADGGAARTHTIDMSNTYLEWADRNFALNDLDSPDHKRERADVLRWLSDPREEEYDLIVVDPPTFSTSKKMTTTWDVQRDHVELLGQVARLTARGGVIYFSTNRRRFKLGDLNLPGAIIQEITEITVPEDYERSSPHQCWRIQMPV